MTPEQPLWIFGYGSLLWRQGFAFAEVRAATIRGYRRVFWQGSTDHRGVPGAPGRVVTLVADRDAMCVGRAFRVVTGSEEETLAALDHRERGGYDRLELRAHLTSTPSGKGDSVRAVTYAATAANPNYLGPADAAAIARQVRAARGPSGSNADYVRELARSLRRLGAEDPHVFEIERLVAEEEPG